MNLPPPEIIRSWVLNNGGRYAEDVEARTAKERREHRRRYRAAWQQNFRDRVKARQSK